jgi:hypothetical protein
MDQRGSPQAPWIPPTDQEIGPLYALVQARSARLVEASASRMNTSDINLLPARTKMMQAWADHLDALRTGKAGKDIPIGRRA